MTMNHLAQSLSKTISDLVLERNRLKQIIDGMNDGLIAVDQAGRCTQVNQMAWTLLGQDESSPPSDLASISQPLANAFHKAIQTGSPACFEAGYSRAHDPHPDRTTYR